MQVFNLLQIKDQILEDAITLEDHKGAYERLDVLWKEEGIDFNQFELGQIFCLVQEQKINQAHFRLTTFVNTEPQVLIAEKYFHDCLVYQIKYAQLTAPTDQKKVDLFKDKREEIINLAQELGEFSKEKFIEEKDLEIDKKNQALGIEAVHDLVTWMRRQVGLKIHQKTSGMRQKKKNIYPS